MAKRAGSTTPVILLIGGQARDVPRAAMALPPGAIVTASVVCGQPRGVAGGMPQPGPGPRPLPLPQGPINRLVARPGRDVVLLTLAGGPTLVLHPAHARELLDGAGAPVPEPGTLSGLVPEPGMAPAPGFTRGGLALREMLAEVSIVTGLWKKATSGAVLAAIVHRIDGAIDEGLYRLDADAAPAHLAGGGARLARARAGAADSAGALLVLVHGTFVDTGGSFGALWRAHPTLVRTLFAHYQGRVYGFDHTTMGRGPIANALTLARALPAGAELHLLTHSRGGLVAEALARACAGNPLRDDELARFGAPDLTRQLADLRALFALARDKALSVTRVTRVACPARGTLLASRRFDLYLSLLGWGLQLAGLPIAAQLVEFMHQVALRRTDPAQLPGIEAMMDGSATIAWLNDGTAVPGQLRVVAGRLAGDTPAAWLEALLAQAFYWSANDLVVQTAAMYGGAVRADGEAGYFLASGAEVTHFSYFIHPETARASVDALTLSAPGQFVLLDAALREGREQQFVALETVPLAGRRQDLAESESESESDSGTWSKPQPQPQLQAQAPARPPLPIAIHNADLRFFAQPLLAGHYSALRLTGAERALDAVLGGAMSAALRAGLYPDAPGSHQVFCMAGRTVIVAGLGEEGALGAVTLRHTARQAILGYARLLSERSPAPSGFEMAATLAGSGGTRMSAGAAALALAQAAADADLLLQAGGWPRLTRLTLVELYLDRASDAWRALRTAGHGAAAPVPWRLEGRISFGAGALRSPQDSSYRGADYDFISALSAGAGSGVAPSLRRELAGPHPVIAYTLDTRRARMEVHAQRAQGALVRELVAEASNHARIDPQIGRTLFQLLVPAEIEACLAGAGDLVIELDETTAAIPWELLDAGPRDTEEPPWAVRCKLVRKLRLERFRQQPCDAGPDDHVLVIGEPLCQRFPRLPGARREALAVAAALTRGKDGADGMDGAGGSQGLAAGRLTLLASQADAHTVINALYRRPWRMLHVAGHGVAGPDGGVALSGAHAVLGIDEVAAMRVAPELVFLNCCHLGAFGAPAGGEAETAAGADADAEVYAVDGAGAEVAGAADAADAANAADAAGAAGAAGATPGRYDRAAFAANMAEALIRGGVRCVIAAGWAVEDHAAVRFAAAFYDALLNGARFIDAVGAARAAAWRANPQGNTWAAYQCYGDPEWRWRQRPDGGVAHDGRPDRHGDEADRIASAPALVLLLEALATEGGSRAALAAGGPAPPASAPSPDISLRLERLERAFGSDWGDIGAVAEAFGAACAGNGLPGRALAWYRRALQSGDGTASLRAAEQWAALLLDQSNAAPEQADIDRALVLLRALIGLHPTPARQRLLASLLTKTQAQA